MKALEVKELTKVYPEFTLDKVSFVYSRDIFPDLSEGTARGKARQLKVFCALSMQKEASLPLEKIFSKRKWLLNRR